MKIHGFDPDAGLQNGGSPPGKGPEQPPVLGATAMEARLLELQEGLRQLPEGASPTERAEVQLQIGDLLVELERNREGWEMVRPAFDAFATIEDWENAARACEILFRSGEPGALSALGQGIWLAVTFPMDPGMTITLLHHVVEDTPDDSDGAAIAAAAAVYLSDLRAQGQERENLLFFANQILGNVARRHSKVDDEEQFQSWYQRLELDQPEAFLPRLRTIINVLIQDDWWINHEKIHANLPED